MLNTFLKNIFLILVIGFLYSCGSEINVTSLSNKIPVEVGAGGGAGPSDNVVPAGPSVENIVISSSELTDVGDNSFSISVNFTGDENSNSSAMLYYCNETDSPGCDPVAMGNSIPLVKGSGNQFSVDVNGLSSPFDLGDTVNYLVVISDEDGVTNQPVMGQTRLLTFYKIYRSVGANNTTALATGGGNNLTIANSIGTFATPLPNNIGVGDALQFDSDNNTSIDKIVFISERIDANNFRLANTNGSAVSDLSLADQDWSLFRAYTSLVNAESGIENTGIDDAVENFDTWSGGKDLVVANQQWNIAFYADAPLANDNFVINGWITSKPNYLKFFVPSLSSEVGLTQRHAGFRNTGKANLTITTDSAFEIGANHVRVEGFQIFATDFPVFENAVEFGNPTSLTSNGEIYFNQNLVFHHGVASGGTTTGALTVIPGNDPSSKVFIYNNIISWDRKSDASCILGRSGYIVAYNNNLINCNVGFRAANGVIRAKNNIVQQIRSQAFSIDSGTFDIESDFNISIDSSSSGGVNDKINAEVTFKNKEVYDYRIAGNSYAAIGAGSDLSSDPYYPITTDITGQTRTRWDIGASTADKAIFRSMGFANISSLKSGSGNDLSISLNLNGHTQASFTVDLASNIGVGDVLQDDADNVGGVDQVAFISQRIDARNYIVKNASGENTVVTTANSQSWDIFRAYTSTTNAENGVENTGIENQLEDFDTWTGGRDLVTNKEEWNIALYADAVETIGTSVTVTGWQADEDFRLKFFTPYKISDVGFSQRHKGKLDDRFYLLEANETTGFFVTDKYVTLEGLQIKTTVLTAAQYIANIRIDQAIGATAATDNIVRNNLLEMNTSQANNNYYGIRFLNDEINLNVKNYIANNIVYFSNNSNGHGIRHDFGRAYIYNNTVAKVASGIHAEGGLNIAKNNIASSYVGSFDSQSNYNLSSNASDTGGANDLLNQSVSFKDEAHFDFRITSEAQNAFDLGSDLSSDSDYAFSDDIIGKSRSRWDAGASEASIQLYRSVGPANTSTLANGASNNLTILNGVASFASALPLKIGVGDVIQYDSDNSGVVDAVVFIHKRSSSISYDVRLSNGLMPNDMAAPDNDWDIFRAYTGIERFVAGNENDGLENIVEDFDIWTDGKDLVSSNEQMNLALYADGVDNISSGDFFKFSTGYSNELNVFTPVDASHVGYRQRHEGVWDDRYYHISIINSWGRVILSGNTYLTGLQVGTSGGLTGVRPINVTNATEVIVDSNIVTGSTDLGNDSAFYANSAQNEYSRIYFLNNIAFDISDDNGQACFGASSYDLKTVQLYFYNNTAVNCQNGFLIGEAGGNTKIHMSNNLSVNSTENDYVGFSLLVENQNNLSSDGSSPYAPLQNKTVSFINPTAKNFRLSPNDTEAKNQGADLSQSFFNASLNAEDNLGHIRGTDGQWDIGAHEAATSIYRSVGPTNTVALQNGSSNNLTIIGSVASFASSSGR